MSHPEPDTAEIDEPEQPNPELADPDEFHRKQRLKEIHRRRQQVSNTLDGMSRYVTNTEHNQNKSNLADAVSLYIAELEPVIERTDAKPELPDALPWDSVRQYADSMGGYKENGETAAAPYEYHLLVFRACNRYIGQVKPLIEEDADEWEV